MQMFHPQAKKKASQELLQGFITPPTGLEPVTPWLTVRCSTDWAMEDRVYVKNTWAHYQLINAANLLRKFRGISSHISPKTNERLEPCLTSVVSCWRIPIFPGRLQPSIFGTTELNFCVRNGNRWTLCVNLTNLLSAVFPQTSCTFRDSNPGPTD